MCTRTRTRARLYEPRLTSRLLVKQASPALTLICAQPHANRDSRHTKWKIELGSTSNAALWRPRRNPACRSNEPKISHQKADYCKLNLTVRPHQRWWIAESHLAGEQRNVTHCSLASCGTDPRPPNPLKAPNLVWVRRHGQSSAHLWIRPDITAAFCFKLPGHVFVVRPV